MWWSRLILIAKTEMIHTLRQGGFYVATIFTVLLFVAAGVLPRLREMAADSPLASVESSLSNELIPITQPIGVVDEAHILVDIPDEHTGLRLVPDVATVAQQFRAGQFDRYYIIPSDYWTTGQIAVFSRYDQVLSTADATLADIVHQNLRGRITPAHLADRLTTPAQLDWGTQPNPPTFRFVPTSIPKEKVSFALLVLGMFTYVLNNSGFLLLQGFERENEARTMEVMLISATPGQLLGGKLIGLSALSLGQMGLALAAGAAVYGQPAAAYGPLPTAALWLCVPFLALGYVVYSTLILGIGLLLPSTGSSAQAQLVLRVVILYPLVGAYLMLVNLQGSTAVSLSLLPFTAHMLMPLRLLLVPVPAWQVGVSFMGLLFFTVGLLWLISRLFRLQTLLTGRIPTPRAVWRAIRTP